MATAPLTASDFAFESAPSNSGAILVARRSTIAHWLTMSPERQRAVLRRYQGRAWGSDLGRCPGLAHFRQFVPYPEAHPKTRLLLLGLEVNFAILRAEGQFDESNSTETGRVVLELARRAERELGHLALSLKTAAGNLEVSPNHLGRIFRRVTGLPFRRFLHGIRVLRTASFLANSTLSAGEIATHLGHVQSSNLSREYRKAIGLWATEFRQLCTAPDTAGGGRRCASFTDVCVKLNR